MRLRTPLRRIGPLQRLRLRLWLPFLKGWLQRKRTGFVPCAFPGCRELIRVPVDDFYRSYSFFSESQQGLGELNFFLGKLRPGEVLYDVGAYRGAYSAAAKARLGNSISIHLFEPVAANYEAIRHIAELNRFSQFHIVPMAAADGTHLQGSITTDDLVFSSGGSTRTAQAADLQAVSLDEYIARGATPPSLLKVDVDGFELVVLHGAQQCLEKQHPRLWLEVHPAYLRNQRRSEEDVLELLRNAGYHFTRFEHPQSPGAADSYHLWCE